METDTLERPADLSIWGTGPKGTRLSGPKHFDRLSEALRAATGALADPGKQPWIVTEDGEMLAPNRIRACFG